MFCWKCAIVIDKALLKFDLEISLSIRNPRQGLSQDLKTGYLKLPIAKFWGALFFKGDHICSDCQPFTYIYLLKKSMISLNNIMEGVLRQIFHVSCIFKNNILRSNSQKCGRLEG